MHLLMKLLAVSEVRLCFKNLFTSNLPQINSIRFFTGQYSRMADKAENNFFTGKSDRFNGITVFSDVENCDIGEFPTKLNESIEFWSENGKRGIWFKVNLEQSEWIPILVKRGFKFHHAKDSFVMLYLWLPKNEICGIPPFAHTLVGVGSVVVNDNNQILVVSEKYFHRPLWKLPGGYVEPGENLVDAAKREVLEETNISTEFQTLLTIRHAHQAMFGCSDIYTVVSLKPLNFDIKKCEREIAASKWMDIDEYLNHPNVHQLNRFFVQKYLEYAKKNIKMDWKQGVHEILNKPYSVYHITTVEEESPSES